MWWQAQLVHRPRLRVALLGLPLLLWVPIARDIFPILTFAAMVRLVYPGTDPSPALLARVDAERRAELAAWESNLR